MSSSRKNSISEPLSALILDNPASIRATYTEMNLFLTRKRNLFGVLACVILLLSCSTRTILAADVVDCDLASAILDAQSDPTDGVVRFTEDCEVSLTEALTVDAALSTSLVIDAQGHKVTVSGDGSFLLFEVTNMTLQVYGIAFSGGSNTNGGAFYIDEVSTVTLSNCAFNGNIAQGTNGISGANGANSSTGNGGSGTSGRPGQPGSGGALYNLGNLEVINCTFTTNSATGGDGGDGGSGGSGAFNAGSGGNGAAGAVANGGAIYSGTGASLIVSNSTFSGNSSSGGKAGAGGAPGASGFGGLDGNGAAGGAASGAAIYSLALVTVVNSTFDENNASGGGSGTRGTQGNSNGSARATRAERFGGGK